MKRSVLLFATFLVTLIISTNSFAGNYKVEILIFKNLTSEQTYNKQHSTPTKQVSDVKKYWHLQTSLLNRAAKKLVTSSNYKVIEHIAWGQKSRPYQSSAIYHLTKPNTTGSIKVYANSLLFVNIDIAVDGYRLTEKRRLKLNEKHFFDHPQFGMLLQVSRL